MSSGAPRPRRGRRASGAVWYAGLAALGLVLSLHIAGQDLTARVGHIVFDAYQRLEPRQQAGDAVVVVDIDEASIAEIGQWPWPRTTMAALVDRLGELGAAAIAFDIVFTDPDRTSPSRLVEALEARGIEVALPEGIVGLDNDEALAEAFARHPVVAGFALGNETSATLPAPKAGFAFGGADPKSYLPAYRGGVTNLPPLHAAAAGAGFFSFPSAHDGVVRDLPLVATARDALYPALSVEALRIAQSAGSYAVRGTDASGETGAGAPAMTALRVGALTLPTGADGSFRVYHSGMPGMDWLPASRLLAEGESGDDPELEEAISGRIVLVGTSALGLRDLVATPLANAVPGVAVHAEIIDQILGRSFLERPDWAPGSELAAALAAGLAVLLLVWRAGPTISGIGTALILAGVAGVSWMAFAGQRLLLEPVLPLAAAAAVFAATMPVRLLIADREKREIRGAFDRYLSPQLVSRVAENPEALRLGGELRDITIFFSDIRGFTTLSEGLGPEELTGLLNDFLTPATDVLLRSDATIDKYIGDAIMAFWNAPLDIVDHRRKACLAALGVIDELKRLNRRSGRDLAIGIGLNAGECCVGNLGSAQRFSYSAIGDAVNLASRVEGLTKLYGVPLLVTDEVRAGAADLAFVEIDRVRVVGRSQPVPVHALLGDADHAATADFAALADRQARFLRAYRAVDIDAAMRALDDVGAVAPAWLYGLVPLYRDRLESMRVKPPDRGWEDVFDARTK